MGIDADEQVMGRVLHLPVRSAAGETAALRSEVLALLSVRRTALVEEMSVALRRAGLASPLEVGGVAVERRLDAAARAVLSALAFCRPLDAAELDDLRRVGGAAARAGVPLWRLLDAVQRAARAGWEYAAEQAVAVVEESRRPQLAARLVAELSVDTMELAGRLQSELAAGYGEVVPPRRLVEPQGSSVPSRG